MYVYKNLRKSKYVSLLSVEVSDAHLHEGTINDVIASKCTYTDKPLPLAGSRRLRSRRTNGNRKH